MVAPQSSSLLGLVSVLVEDAVLFMRRSSGRTICFRPRTTCKRRCRSRWQRRSATPNSGRLRGSWPISVRCKRRKRGQRLLRRKRRRLSPAIAALTKQRVLLTLCETHLSDWRASIASQYDNAWKKLVFALASLTAAIAFLVAAGVLFGRFTAIHIHDANSRRTILIGQRLALWLALILIVLFAFAFDLSSMATFLGLVSAGIAVAMQNVILAVAGYFLLVGKLRIRVGDLVQISGVTGEVVDIGLMQFQLKELDTAGEQPTGRVVSFSNSFVFVSPATGLFKRIQAPASS